MEYRDEVARTDPYDCDRELTSDELEQIAGMGWWWSVDYGNLVDSGTIVENAFGFSLG